MSEDEQPLDEPFVQAVVVAGDEPGTEAVHVFVAWDDVDELADEIAGLLPAICKSVKDDEKFSGDVRFFVARKFLDGDELELGTRLAEAEAAMQADVDQHLPRAANGRPFRVRVRFDA